MPGRLEGRTALVTGGARGIGDAIARAFVREGADGRGPRPADRAPAKATADTLAANGAKVIAVAADVSDEAEVESAVKAATKGLGHIDILVNNAGIDTTSLVAEMPTAMWDEMMAVNLRERVPVHPRRAAGMIARKFGRIISTSSQLAHKGAAEMAHYAAAKAGVIGFTRSLAYEVARDGVTVNAICPGPIDTELFRGIPEAWRKRKLAELPIGRAG